MIRMLLGGEGGQNCHGKGVSVCTNLRFWGALSGRPAGAAVACEGDVERAELSGIRRDWLWGPGMPP